MADDATFQAMCALGQAYEVKHQGMGERLARGDAVVPPKMPKNPTFGISPYRSCLIDDLVQGSLLLRPLDPNGEAFLKEIEMVVNGKIAHAKARRSGRHKIKHKFGMISTLYLIPEHECLVLHRKGDTLLVLRWFSAEGHHDPKGAYQMCLNDLRARWCNVVPQFADLLDHSQPRQYDPMPPPGDASV